MEKPLDKPTRRYRDLDTEESQIIITDADFPVAIELSKENKKPNKKEEEKSAKKELESLGGALSKLGKHFIITLCVTGLAVLMHYVLVHWFGDPKFFDRIPVRYAIDAGDVAVIVSFFVIMIRELWKQKE